METASFIIAVLSLIATIAVSFAIYFLQKRLQKHSDSGHERMEELQRKRDLSNRARDFLYNNIDEKEYLTLCQLAANLHPLVKHGRKIYNEFNRCEADLKKEILKQANIPELELPEAADPQDNDGRPRFDIESKGLEIFEREIEKRGMWGISALEEKGFKVSEYFGKGFDDHRHMRISGDFSEDKKNGVPDKNYFDKRYYTLSDGHYNGIAEQGRYYSRYESRDVERRAEDYQVMRQADLKERELYHIQRVDSDMALSQTDKQNKYAYRTPLTFAEFEKQTKTMPFDFFLQAAAEDAESELCYIIMLLVREGALSIIKENKDGGSVSGIDKKMHALQARAETNEDLYYQALYCVHCCFGDDLFGVQVKSNRT